MPLREQLGLEDQQIEGAPEVTRLGMKKSEMAKIAEFMKRIVVGKEDPKKVKQDVAPFRKDFQDVHYCFESAKKACEYIKLG